MRVNQQCWDFLLCSRVTQCTNHCWFELQTLLIWVIIEPVLRKNSQIHVFVRKKIIPAVVWFFLPVQFQWQPHTTRNLKQVAASNLQNSTGEKNHTTGHKIIPQASNFKPAFLHMQYWVFLWFIQLVLQCESTNSAETFCYAIGSLNAPTIAGLSSHTLDLGDYRASFKEKQPNSCICQKK